MILYIPGLGDGYDFLRTKALHGWKKRQLSTELVPMRWYEGGSYQQTFDRSRQRIMHYQSEGYAVSLIGESAGGSMAINLFAANPTVHRLMTIAGVNSPAAPVAQYLRDKSPAFDGSLRALGISLTSLTDDQRSRIINVTARADPTVSPKHSQIAAAQHYTVPIIGHLTTIAYCLTFGRHQIIRSVIDLDHLK